MSLYLEHYLRPLEPKSHLSPNMAPSPRKKRSLGQHFLRDANMIRNIVDAVPAKPEDKVVEIGPGDGALTKLLIGRYPNLTVIEIDSVMVNHLREE